MSRRLRIRVEGTVQGVGFRPYLYRLARELDLSGWVRNDARGVTVEVEGPSASVERFVERLPGELPPLASVDRLDAEEAPAEGDAGFRIVPSEGGDRPAALVSPDTATCVDCLRELADPRDRRYRYPFINCTNCGPRFTIVRGIPYDRPRTTMAGFAMCDACRSEYEDPGDRRFHAQPNACPACGPAARLVHPDGTDVEADDARDDVEAAARALRDGAVLAVKGLGGYHLACVADDEAAVAALRARKHREDKPFALMPVDVEAARSLVELGPLEEELLRSRARPIVLARRRPDAPVAPSVAPGHRDLGVMLPYSPLHHLLLGDLGRTLVMTSGNVSDEPIAYRDEDALERLGNVADLFLVHDRPIETRTDDSVARVVSVAGARRPMLLRRSRGYVPAPSTLPVDAGRPILACGGHLKNTFALARGRRAWVGPHVGDLENLETLRSFEEGVAHLQALFEITPERLAHDLHPDYLSTAYARERAPRSLEGVQHHHAHLAACLAEHGESGPALGVIYDGTGYGSDGTVWGGELLVGDLADSERVGHLRPVRLPGGEAAVREPWRMACAWLAEAAGAMPDLPPFLAHGIEARDWRNVARLALGGSASPVTTSMGRFFDAVSALAGVRLRVTYEGQAAIELEMRAAAEAPEEVAPYPLPVVEGEKGGLVLDGVPTVEAVREDAARGVPAGTIGVRFHASVAEGTVAASLEVARRHGVETVVLSGGVFQNVLLLERTAEGLVRAGLRVLVPGGLPPNDGGLSYGQLACAAARLEAARG